MQAMFSFSEVENYYTSVITHISHSICVVVITFE